MNISITQAKVKFSQIICKVESGESVTITRHGEPVAILNAVQHSPTVPKIGSMKGKIEFADDFDELPRNSCLRFNLSNNRSEIARRHSYSAMGIKR